jgi:hypothetical protein
MKAHAIIGEILAAWEDAANTAAIDCHRNAEDDADRLLRHGLELPANATDEERAGALRLAWQAVENGRELAKAWRAVANGLRRYMRVLRVETYSERRVKAANAPAKPWERRHEHDAAMQAGSVVPQVVERAPIVLDRDKLESEARASGLWKEGTSEPET